MNKYVRAAVCVPCGMIKIAWTKLSHPSSFSGPLISLISPLTEITMDNGATLRIGKNFKMRDGAKIRVRKGATCIIGNNSSVNCNNMIACRERIEIGNDVQMSPNVQIYDHDHDFRVDGGIKAGKYKTAPVKIGNNVWIGASVHIMPGVTIGDGAVIGGGSVVVKDIPANCVAVGNPCKVIRKINQKEISLSSKEKSF